jgi:hypothetical protein
LGAYIGGILERTTHERADWLLAFGASYWRGWSVAANVEPPFQYCPLFSLIVYKKVTKLRKIKGK